VAPLIREKHNSVGAGKTDGGRHGRTRGIPSLRKEKGNGITSKEKKKGLIPKIDGPRPEVPGKVHVRWREKGLEFREGKGDHRRRWGKKQTLLPTETEKAATGIDLGGGCSFRVRGYEECGP